MHETMAHSAAEASFLRHWSTEKDTCILTHIQLAICTAALAANKKYGLIYFRYISNIDSGSVRADTFMISQWKVQHQWSGLVEDIAELPAAAKMRVKA